jgi:hypothetical protein
MAAKKAKNKIYIVSVKDNPDFCGVGAGGAQFAQGKARIENPKLANWFKEHSGYVVTEEKVTDTDTTTQE